MFASVVKHCGVAPFGLAKVAGLRGAASDNFATPAILRGAAAGEFAEAILISFWRRAGWKLGKKQKNCSSVNRS
jgi:hypothetical protein